MCTSSLHSDIFSYVIQRQEDYAVKLVNNAGVKCFARRFPEAMQENELNLGDVDKVFAAKWLDEFHVICGTKCNKLIVQNVLTKQRWMIPILKDSGKTPKPEKNCGIHTISLNQSSTKLATGAENPSVVGFYNLPSLSPIAIGEFHKDWLFTSSWISDDILATGSRDKCLAFWSVRDCENDSSLCVPVLQPVQTVQRSQTLDKVRDMIYNPFLEHLTTVASNGFVHIWDVKTCSQVVCNSLPFPKENVCIAHEKCNLLYAVGSLSHVSLLETRSARAIGSLSSNDRGAGVRSLSFKDCIITIGTGSGSLLFYDIRMNKMLDSLDGSHCRRKTGRGWLRRDSVYREFFWDAECYPNAVYAHAYHPTSMRLLTAGGPLALGLYGNYVAYWD